MHIHEHTPQDLLHHLGWNQGETWNTGVNGGGPPPADVRAATLIVPRPPGPVPNVGMKARAYMYIIREKPDAANGSTCAINPGSPLLAPLLR